MAKVRKVKFDTLAVMHPDAAGLDLGDESAYAAVPVGRDPDGQDVRCFSALTDGIESLVAWLKVCMVDSVAMEATGVYWMPVYSILERHGLQVCLVNPREVKQVPGRKSDVCDARWLQKLASVGFLRSAMIPEGAIRTIRVYMRQRERHIQAAMEATAHMRDALVQMNVRVDQAIRDITGQTGQRIIAAIIAGERDASVLAELRAPNCKKSAAEIAACLNGEFREEHIFVLKQSHEEYHHHQQRIADVDAQLQAHLRATMPHDAPTDTPEGEPKPEKGNALHFDGRTLLYHYIGVDLTAVTGIATLTAMNIVSELGRDFSQFPTVKHFTSYLGLSPDNRITGGKVVKRGRRKVGSRAAKAFRLAANSLYRTDSPLGEFFRRQRYKHGPSYAVIVTANKLARIVYHMVTRKCAFDMRKLIGDAEQAREKAIKRLQCQAHKMGFSLTPCPQEAAGS
jgi:transposase